MEMEVDGWKWVDGVKDGRRRNGEKGKWRERGDEERLRWEGGREECREGRDGRLRCGGGGG